MEAYSNEVNNAHYIPKEEHYCGEDVYSSAHDFVAATNGSKVLSQLAMVETLKVSTCMTKQASLVFGMQSKSVDHT